MGMNLAGDVAFIVDTNLFLECRALADLPWEELGFAQVELIVSRPVQQELDNHKKNERGRTFKKALAANKLLRQLVTSGQSELVIRETSPRVVMSIMPAARLQAELSDQLDPSFNDDAILLRLLQYQRDHQGIDVRLITHDTGPMTTAQSLGIKFIPIPDTWLMREQDDPATKEINKLKVELQRLRSQEPKFNIEFTDHNGNKVSRLNAEVDTYPPLGDEQVQGLMEQIRQKFPIVTEFGSAETTPKPTLFPPTRGFQRITVTEFTPASEDEIERYQQDSYPKWLSACQDQLEKLHSRLNAVAQWPEIDFVIANSGTRPALRSLVKFLAQGNIVIFPPRPNEDDEETSDTRGADSIRLPQPPKPPRGVWRESSAHPVGRMAALMSGRINDPFGPTMRHADLGLAHLRPPKPRDADSFYWKDGRPSTAKRLIELTCDNWRHGVDEEHFLLRITPTNAENVSGAIQCEIHAANLSDPVTLTLPVRIERKVKSTFDHAQSLIALLRPC